MWCLALSPKNKAPRSLLPFLRSFDHHEVLRHPSSPFSLAMWGLELSPKNKTPRSLLPFLRSFDHHEVLRHPSSPFSCIEVSTIGTSLPKQ
ncbi:hypothetical protein AVEN_160592-1 [Araneus ventricosus]|uniref:Uncharacterized protein n=1 Tax=Araneus ventricosus TaxID=182803 RepID=A0A4Y2DQ63_ARAVE|nr:hypothetical protein AVEN_160592-1 [Araneus ventricosus]